MIRRLALLLSFLGLVFACGTPSLVPGDPATDSISVGDAPHPYAISLHVGDFLELSLDQDGDNMGLRLSDPQGQPLLEVDTPNGPYGRERLFTVAEESGEYRVAVELYGQVGGSYTLLAEVRPASEEDRRRALACRLLNEDLFARDPVEALEAGERALALWDDLDEPYLATVALLRLGHRFLKENRHAEAVEVLRRAHDRLESLETRDLTPAVLIDLARGLDRTEGFEAARAIYEQALRAAKDQADRWREGVALNWLALSMYQNRRQVWVALGRIDQALEIFEDLHDFREQAITHLNRGLVLNWLGREDAALKEYDAALDLRQGPGTAPRDRAEILLEKGWALMWTGETEQAETTMLEAQSLLEEDDRQLRAACSDRLGTLYRREGRLEESRAAYQSALNSLAEARDDDRRAHVLSNLGRTYGELGDTERGFEVLAEAQHHFAEKEERSALAYARANRARLLRQVGDLQGAKEELEEALALHEELREEAGSSGYRSTYLETVYEHFQLYVDLLMELEAAQPGRDWAVRALEAVERSRARSLLELVAELGAERQRESGRTSGIAGEGTASLVSEPRSLEEIRSALDPDTALLVYAVGENRSFVWWVGPEGLKGFEKLDSKDELAQQIRPLVEAMETPAEVSSGAEERDETLARLGRELLPRDSLPPHLVVVPDGALHYLPFGALRVDGRPLIEDHRVSRLPSASVLLALRDRWQIRAPAPARLGVIADPVFEPGDSRLPAEAAAMAKEHQRRHRQENPSTLDLLIRLEGSGEEANRIESLVDEGCYQEARGLNASHETASEDWLAQFGVLHFATHALLDDELPERSQVVLSRFDSEGKERNGSLFAFEIAEMDLAADLVVLSACQTALGREIRGEGLVGLPQSFFEAGADRVVVSLWNVDDKATTELIGHFYEGLLHHRLPPAEALRRAQNHLRLSELFQDPYYWAPFTLSGDWRALSSTLLDSQCLQP